MTSTVDRTTDEAALHAFPQRIVAAWGAYDADAFAEVFTADGSMILPGGIYATSREQIRGFMRAAFAGPYQRTQVVGEPISIRRLGDDTAVITTQGGVRGVDDAEVAPEKLVRATWVVTRDGDDWRLVSYQNTPIAAA
jgi:uncharacterized protein (TIGR02246 family)